MNGNSGGGGGTTSAGGGMWLSPPSAEPCDMFGCRDFGTPAFLTKTFSIVNDPNTNSIISWSLLGDSFIIWDHLKFSAEILPRFFRHDNLASFVYQLNSYGFRKIGVNHQWEYENPNFQAGKSHLLTNITRRTRNLDATRRRSRVDNNNNIMEIIRKEILRNKINESKLEIKKLKKQQEEMELQIMVCEEEAKKMENNSKKLMMYNWAKACNQIFAHKKRASEETEKENSDDDGIIKKMKMDSVITAEKNKNINTGFEGKDNFQDHEEMVVKEQTYNPLSENQPVLSTDDDSGSQIQHDQEEANANSVKNSDYKFWKVILLEDDEECESETGTEMANKQAKIALDLEGLIKKLDNHDKSESVTITL